MHACEVHAHEVYPHEMHAHEMHAHKMHVREVHAHETHAYEIHVRDIHVRDMHARKVHAHETPAHHCFGGSLAQTVVDLSRSKFQNTSFCASCGVPIRCPPAAAVYPGENLELATSKTFPAPRIFNLHQSTAKHVTKTISHSVRREPRYRQYKNVPG